jgi:hypothetical protein
VVPERFPLSTRDIDAYLAALEEPKRSTRAALRHRILEVVPRLEHRIGMRDDPPKRLSFFGRGWHR